MTDLIRILVVSEMVALVGCGAMLHSAAWPHLPRHFRVVGTAFGWVVACVGLAVTLNLATRQPLSPGVVVLGVAVAPAIVAVIAETARTVRRNP